MGKRICNFSKEYEGLDNNKVIEILESNGISGKKSQSGISEEEEAMVAKVLAKEGFKKIGGDVEEVASKAVAPKVEAPKTEAPKVEASKAESPKAGTAPKNESDDKPQKKKKSIIIVGNDNNRGAQNRNAQNNYNNDRRNGGGTYRPLNNDNRTPQRAQIKPRDNMIDRAAEVTNRRLMQEREEQQRIEAEKARQAEENAKTVEAAQKDEAATPVTPVVRENVYANGYKKQPYNNNRDNNGNRNNGRDFGGNRNGNNGQSKDFGGNRSGRDFNGQGRPQGGRPGEGRPGATDNRFARNGQGGRPQGGRPMGGGKSFASDAPAVPENDRRRDRNNSKDKDRKSRNDYLYEDDNEVVKGNDRNSKAGRFQKPVKVKETVPEDEIKVITLPEMITIKDLADKMRIQPSAIVKKLFMQGKMVTVNQEISFEEAEEIAIEYEIMCEQEEKVDVIAELLKEEEELEENLVSRPPVICVMGHVDHGKTSLLDAIRNTNVTEREAGGITQAIGAYTVKVNDRKITFLDTPGHEAFTSMRMRGANSTDIAILVVAADDGVMPQTVEAINHAKAAGIEIIVAVNKIDKPGANIDRVKQELTEYELVAEDWGGQTIFAPVSAKTGEGIEDLLEMILLTADVLDLKSNPNRKARGLVIEAELDKGRGPVATVLVQKGTLHVGDFISAGAASGKVRAMVDDKGRRVREAGPSTPVEILGLSDVPNAGEIFICHDNDKQAKSYAETFIAQNRAKLLEETKGKMSLDDLYSKIQEGNLKELNIIIKADVQGSVEAVKQSLLKLSNEEVVVKVIHGGVGAINESDVILASASQAIIIGFNVRPDAQAKSTAEHEGVDVRLYKVIYQAIEEMEAAMKGMLDAVYEEKIIGHAEVQQIFKASAIGNIAGARVMDGHIQRDCKVRITREGELIFEGELKSLKRFKDDVKEVKEGFECGLVFEEFDSMQEHDMVEAYIMVEVPRD